MSETLTTTRSAQRGSSVGRRDRLAIVWVSQGGRVSALPSSGQMVLGRADQCEVHLCSAQVSRRHARLECERGQWLVRDLESRNGTFVNGRRVQEAQLCEQDVVRLGEWVGVVARISPERLARGDPTSDLSSAVFAGTALDRVYAQVKKIADAGARVVLVGDTGTGKDVLARELHRLSGLSGEFVAINCAAVPEQLAEGELFGYRRGAFTGADRAHVGVFQRAHGGTLFLDEIADLAPAIQAKLLRVLEERCVVPLGQTSPEPANARIVSACQRPLHEYVEEGRFRLDLYSRLCALEIEIPPLRARREEVVGLFLRFLNAENSACPTLSNEFVEQLSLYDWPLNVREVVQLAERTRALHADVRVLRLEHLPTRVATYCRLTGAAANESLSESANRWNATSSLHRATHGNPHYGDRSLAGRTLSEANQPARDRVAQRFLSILEESQGNVALAARRFGISRPRAYRLMRRLERVDPESLRLEALLGADD